MDKMKFRIVLKKLGHRMCGRSDNGGRRSFLESGAAGSGLGSPGSDEEGLTSVEHSGRDEWTKRDGRRGT